MSVKCGTTARATVIPTRRMDGNSCSTIFPLLAPTRDQRRKGGGYWYLYQGERTDSTGGWGLGGEEIYPFRRSGRRRRLRAKGDGRGRTGGRGGRKGKEREGKGRGAMHGMEHRPPRPFPSPLSHDFLSPPLTRSTGGRQTDAVSH